MKKFFFSQVMVFLIAQPALSATYMMVTPEDLDLEVPSHAIMWQEKFKKKEKLEASFNCDEQDSKLSTIHADYKFSDVETCEKMQVMLRLATVYCPLQLEVDGKAEKINSFQLECENLKL